MIVDNACETEYAVLLEMRSQYRRGCTSMRGSNDAGTDGEMMFWEKKQMKKATNEKATIVLTVS